MLILGARLEKRLLEYLGVTYEEVKDLWGKTIAISSRINFNSSDQLAKILFEDMGFEVIEETPTGKPKTGKITLDKYKDDPFVQLLREYKGCEKLLSSFKMMDV